MKTRDMLELAARNLRESKLRNSLTTLGIGVGVASLGAAILIGAFVLRGLGRRSRVVS